MAVHAPTAPRRRWGSTVAGLLVLAVMLFPLYWMLNTALQPDSGLLQVDPVPPGLDLSGFTKALTDQGGNLLTSLLVSAGAVVICLAVAAPAAYGLARFGLRGSRTIVFGTLITQMVPGIVIANALYTSYVDLGLVNSYAGVLVPWLAGIIGIFLVRQYALSIPDELLEAARIDGASEWDVFRHVVLPILRPAVATLALFVFLGSWNDFMWPLIVLSDQDLYTLPVALASLGRERAQDIELMMAGSVVTTVPVLLLFLALQRQFIGGLLAGSVKG